MEIVQVNKVQLVDLLRRFPESEQAIWSDEAVRLADIVVRYQALSKKRRLNPISGKNDFTKEVRTLCKEAACTVPQILCREPSRARPPSPFTLDRWSKKYKEVGLSAFFRALPDADPQLDNRRASISIEAFSWIKENWRKYKTPTYFYKDMTFSKV